MPTNNVNLQSNITQKLIRKFLEKFESMRVLSKNVNTQLLSGEFNPSTGDEVNFKRPTDYRSIRTPDGDITGLDKNQIITGKAAGRVQDYITVPVEFKQVDQALALDQLDELIEPMALRVVTDLEVDFARFMMRNVALRSGIPGFAINDWGDVAAAGALMETLGIPGKGMWKMAVNPFAQIALANDQKSLGAGGDAGKLISAAHKEAIIATRFAGMTVMSATTLGSYKTPVQVDRAGTLSAIPNMTYLTHKDSMVQAIAVENFTGAQKVLAGETLTIAGIERLNLSTRESAFDADANAIAWTGTVVEEVDLVAGAGIIMVTGPAIFEALGQYNTVNAAPAANAVVTLTTPADESVQPSLFWHPNAFGIGSVPLQKLNGWDAVGTTKDGMQIRCVKYSDGDANTQMIRFDLLPAYAALNPFLAGQAHGLT